MPWFFGGMGDEEKFWLSSEWTMNIVWYSKHLLSSSIIGYPLIDGNIYFVGLDIVKVLGYSNERKAINTHCKHPIKTTTYVSSQNGRSHKPQKMWCITNSDIYRLIVKSEMESADKFES